jgi:hypothetical protein
LARTWRAPSAWFATVARMPIDFKNPKPAEHQLEACKAIGAVLASADLVADTHLQQLVGGTFARSLDTFAAIVALVEQDLTTQAAMLLRPLFEDMAVAHWLVLNEADADYFIQRFLRHCRALAVAAHTTYGERGWEAPGDPPHEDEASALRAEFGRYATEDWWGKRPDGSTVGMRDLVAEIANSDRFDPRLKGETSAVEDLYSTVTVWASKTLHHTGMGVPIRLDEGGGRPRSLTPPVPVQVLFPAYWVFAQLVYLVHEVQGWDFREFEALFIGELAEAFYEGSYP